MGIENLETTINDERAENDLRQHADKIIQALEKLNEQSSKRAIWELFQNAIDLSENCEIIVEQKTDSLDFSHNGKQFKTKTLDCLIIQVSNKGNNRDDEVGQYGTGFLTTHSYGKKIFLSGSLEIKEEENGQYIHFNGFEIDRKAADSVQLIKKIQKQRMDVDELTKNPIIKNHPAIWTRFSYQNEEEIEKQNVEDSIKNIPELLPYVMTINHKLKKVTVIDKDNNKTIFEKGEATTDGDILITTIKINQENKYIYSIASDNNDLMIILPFSDNKIARELPKKVPKLFLFFPLIGTENFGFNFIIHHKCFFPTEARDGIHIKSNNPQITDKEDENRRILENITSVVKEFITKNVSAISNRQHLAIINFTHDSENKLLSEYLKTYKKTWLGFLKDIPLVESNGNFIKPIDACFFEHELLEDKYIDAIYSIVQTFWNNIPNKEIVKKWSKIVRYWEEKDRDKENEIKLISIDDILEKINGNGKLDIFIEKDIVSSLQKFYSFLIEKEKTSCFMDMALLPNIKTNFKKQNELYSHSEIDSVLVEIADVIIPEIPEHFIHDDFKFTFELHEYNKKEYSKDINDFFNKKINEENTLSEEINTALIKYCTIFNSSKDTSKRRDLIRLICRHYNHSPDFMEISNTSQDIIDWRPPVKLLIRNIAFNLKDRVFEPKIYHDLLSIICSWSEVADLIETLPLFPNQMNQICKRNELKIDDKIPEEMKDLYDKIINNNEIKIKHRLLYTNNKFDFSSFLVEDNILKIETIASEIERKLTEGSPITDIKNHKFKNEIMAIIKTIRSDNQWERYFPQINNEKEIIFFGAFEDNEAKKMIIDLLMSDDINRIIKLIELGKEEEEKKERSRINWEHKEYIGKYIENIVRNKIDKEIKAAPVKTVEQQCGQDIIIYHGSRELYFIEIKSRWTTDSSVSMSPKQMETATKHIDNYALVYVDMCDYHNSDRYKAKIENILDKIKVITSIGKKVKRFEGIFEFNETEEDINLINYRGQVSQKLINDSGIPLDGFIIELINRIKENI